MILNLLDPDADHHGSYIAAGTSFYEIETKEQTSEFLSGLRTRCRSQCKTEGVSGGNEMRREVGARYEERECGPGRRVPGGFTWGRPYPSLFQGDVYIK